MKKLDFGTAGIRGILGSGEYHLNDIHIIRVTEGFAKYLLANFKDVKKQGIVIGRDNRRKSKRFAEIAASILTKYEINVHYNQEIAPTPFISFATRVLGAAGAINITASHNPKEYNGVKLYDKEGCQLLPGETTKLLTHFNSYQEYENVEVTFAQNQYFHYITNDLMDSYLDQVKKIGGEIHDFSNIKIAYTPQHGTGALPVTKLFNDLNVQAFYEENEMKEDTEFTFSATPNPEAKESFDNVLIVAKNNNCDIALVTDPDADRVGLAIKHKESYKILSGNETAILIFNYLLEQLNEKDLKNYYLVYSFVSSSLPRKMAEANGLKSYMTETGFKWIGNLVNDLSQSNPEQKFLYAFEESYGSLIDENICRDKDAIQSIVVLTKMASHYKKLDMDLMEVLDKIYQKYGFVESGSIVLNIESNSHLENVKDAFQKLNIADTTFLDYNKGINSIEPNDMLTYEFADGSWISLRPSGTEPKIKIYLFFTNKNEKQAVKNYNTYFELLSNL